MNDFITERVVKIALDVVNNKHTVREAANIFKVSKSTVHKDMVERLPLINPVMSKRVRQVLDQNLAERHIRGGEATKMKYK